MAGVFLLVKFLEISNPERYCNNSDTHRAQLYATPRFLSPRTSSFVANCAVAYVGVLDGLGSVQVQVDTCDVRRLDTDAAQSTQHFSLEQIANDVFCWKQID